MSAVASVKNCVSTTDTSINPFQSPQVYMQRDNFREGWWVHGWGRRRISFEDQRWEEEDWDPESLLRRQINARPLTPPLSSSPLLPRPLTPSSSVSLRKIGEKTRTDPDTVRLRLQCHR